MSHNVSVLTLIVSEMSFQENVPIYRALSKVLKHVSPADNEQGTGVKKILYYLC